MKAIFDDFMEGAPETVGFSMVMHSLVSSFPKEDQKTIKKMIDEMHRVVIAHLARCNHRGLSDHITFTSLAMVFESWAGTLEANSKNPEYRAMCEEVRSNTIKIMLEDTLRLKKFLEEKKEQVT